MKNRDVMYKPDPSERCSHFMCVNSGSFMGQIRDTTCRVRDLMVEAMLESMNGDINLPAFSIMEEEIIQLDRKYKKTTTYRIRMIIEEVEKVED